MRRAGRITAYRPDTLVPVWSQPRLATEYDSPPVCTGEICLLASGGDDLTVVNLECPVSDRGAAVPKEITFTELPKTSTGKIQKNVLRDGGRR